MKLMNIKPQETAQYDLNANRNCIDPVAYK